MTEKDFRLKAFEDVAGQIGEVGQGLEKVAGDLCIVEQRIEEYEVESLALEAVRERINKFAVKLGRLADRVFELNKEQ